MDKNILLIINPKSGKKKNESVYSRAEEILSLNNNVTVVYTKSRGHATELAKNSKGYDRVVCMGGDGTLSEVCNGVLMLPQNERPQVGYIPSGSTNDFAKGIGLPKSIAKSSKIAASELVSPIDIGAFNADNGSVRYFTYVASFGAFTKISYATAQDFKNKLGHFAYIFEGIKSIGDFENFKPFKLKVETNDTVLEQEYIFGALTNSTSLAGLVKMDKRNVKVNDGYFELLLIRKPQNFLDLTGTVTSIINKKYKYDKIIFAHTANLKLTSEIPLDFTLDGEYAGAVTHTEISVIHNAVDFVRPEQIRKKPFPKKKKP